jgi:hypothetical protein
MDNYERAFATFRAASDVVQVEAEALGDELRERGVRSLCDVGAGPGDLARRLASVVDTYVAVESRPDYAAALRSLGLSVVEGSWPSSLTRRFDCVVMSHVLRSRADVDPMVGAAIDVLTPDGVLLVALHEIEGTEWQRLMQQIDMADRLQDDLRTDVELTLAKRGFGIRRRELRTRVSAETAATTIRALSFVASAGEPEGADEFVQRLGRAGSGQWLHQTDGSCAFDLTVVLLSAQRGTTSGRPGK